MRDSSQRESNITAGRDSSVLHMHNLTASLRKVGGSGLNSKNGTVYFSNGLKISFKSTIWMKLNFRFN